MTRASTTPSTTAGGLSPGTTLHLDLAEAGTTDPGDAPPAAGRTLPRDGPGSDACRGDYPENPTIKGVLARVGDKWSLLIMGLLAEGPLRFTELQRRVDGISHRMLTQTLRSLERDGLVIRTAYPEIPPRVEYEVTPLGDSLITPVLALVNWAASHHGEITAARERYDAAHD